MVTWQIKSTRNSPWKGLWPWNLASWWLIVMWTHRWSNILLSPPGHMRLRVKLKTRYFFLQKTYVYDLRHLPVHRFHRLKLFCSNMTYYVSFERETRADWYLQRNPMSKINRKKVIAWKFLASNFLAKHIISIKKKQSNFEIY